MINKILNVISPKRRKIRSQFGKYCPDDLVDAIANEKKSDSEEKLLRVIYFYSEWGFGDSAIPKIQEVLSRYQLDLQQTHSSILIRCIGEDEKDKYNQILKDFELLLQDADFEDFKICKSEGLVSNFHDYGKVENEAISQSKEYQQASGAN